MQSSQGHDLQYKAGEMKGHAQVKKDEMMEKACSAAEAVKDKANSACDKATGAQDCKKQTGGLLQQTGEQMKNMAQGAADAVKNTLGVGDGSATKHRLSLPLKLVSFVSFGVEPRAPQCWFTYQPFIM